MRKPIAYLASPLGFSEAGRLFYNTVLIPMVTEIGFEIRNPWTLTPASVINPVLELPYGQEKKEKLSELNFVMGKNNVSGIEQSDIIIAVLDGPDVESGTSGEIGYGAALGKRIFGYRSDFRLSSDNEGSVVNMQIEFFIHMSGGQIVKDMESLKRALIKYMEEIFESCKVID